MSLFDMEYWEDKAKELRPGDLIEYRCNSPEVTPVLGIVIRVRESGFVLKPLFTAEPLELKGLFPHKILGHIENFDPSA